MDNKSKSIKKNADIIPYDENNLVYDEYKLNFVIKYLNLVITDIAKDFGLHKSSISKMSSADINATEGNKSGLKPVHFYALESAYDIPKEIFFDKNIKTESDIKYILDNRKAYLKSNVFCANREILNTLVGVWYSYFFKSDVLQKIELFNDSTLEDEIYCIKTNIDKDGKVLDENNNGGEVYISENQSMIIKKADNSKNLISMTFDNSQIRYGKISFTLVSKTNGVNKKMFSFGFLSRQKLDIDTAKQILQSPKDMQFKISDEFEERIKHYS